MADQRTAESPIWMIWTQNPHGDGLGIKPKRVFTNAEGSQMCWEYVHNGMVTGTHARRLHGSGILPHGGHIGNCQGKCGHACFFAEPGPCHRIQHQH